MFGYIKPCADELKVGEYERYKACYCALCHTLKAEYGGVARFTLSYDFVFLAMLLWEAGLPPEKDAARCPVSPLRKKATVRTSPALSGCAGCSVILGWWQLRDTVRDEPFFKSLRSRIYGLLMGGAYKKAARRYGEFEARVRSGLAALDALEESGTASLDACADAFAAVTAALAGLADSGRRRALEQALYHTGRFIYILDACDDLADDLKAGRANPVARRFGTSGGALDDGAREALKTTLLHSCSLVGAAFELLPENDWTPVTRNIIYLGMPGACTRVLGQGEGAQYE